MRNLLITTAIASTFAGVAFAEDTAAYAGPTLSGEVSLDFAETAAGDYGGSMGLELNVDAMGMGDVALGFAATEGNALTLDTWTVGTPLPGGIDIAMGNDNGAWVGAEGEQTLAAPGMNTGVQVGVAGATVALGFTDWTADLTDLENIQGSYTVDMGGLDVTAAADYNFDSEDFAVGAEVAGLDVGVAELGGALTYDGGTEAIGYEVVADAFGATAFVNGDDSDMLQNVGGEYAYGLGGATVTAGATYNFDAEEVTPTVGVSFAF